MKYQISFRQYRWIDLGFLLAMMMGSQVLLREAWGAVLPGMVDTLSPVAAVTAMGMMRWGGIAAIYAVLGGLFFAAVIGAGAETFVIYGVGNLAAAGAVLLIRGLGKGRIRGSWLWTMVLGLCVQGLMLLGRAITAACLGGSMAECLGLITADAPSLVFTALVLLLLGRVDGMLEDQKEYIRRKQGET